MRAKICHHLTSARQGILLSRLSLQTCKNPDFNLTPLCPRSLRKNTSILRGTYLYINIKDSAVQKVERYHFLQMVVTRKVNCVFVKIVNWGSLIHVLGDKEIETVFETDTENI